MGGSTWLELGNGLLEYIPFKPVVLGVGARIKKTYENFRDSRKQQITGVRLVSGLGGAGGIGASAGAVASAAFDALSLEYKIAIIAAACVFGYFGGDRITKFIGRTYYTKHYGVSNSEFAYLTEKELVELEHAGITRNTALEIFHWLQQDFIDKTKKLENAKDVAFTNLKRSEREAIKSALQNARIEKSLGPIEDYFANTVHESIQRVEQIKTDIQFLSTIQQQKITPTETNKAEVFSRLRFWARKAGVSLDQIFVTESTGLTENTVRKLQKTMESEKARHEKRRNDAGEILRKVSAVHAAHAKPMFTV